MAYKTNFLAAILRWYRLWEESVPNQHKTEWNIFLIDHLRKQYLISMYHVITLITMTSSKFIIYLPYLESYFDWWYHYFKGVLCNLRNLMILVNVYKSISTHNTIVSIYYLQIEYRLESKMLKHYTFIRGPICYIYIYLYLT